MAFRVDCFVPVALHVQGLGPFTDHTQSFWFEDKEHTPTNLYLIVGVNGLGKTTLLECIATLLGLLDGGLRANPPPEPEWLTDHDNARAQLDVLVELSEGDGARRGILSLVLCRVRGLRHPTIFQWLPKDLDDHGCDFEARLASYRPNSSLEWLELAFNKAGETDDHATELIRGLREHIERARSSPAGNDLMAPIEDAPALLLFTSHRDLLPRVPTEQRAISQPPEWNHSLVRRFDVERGWASSLDHLLVWLDYIDGRRPPELGRSRFDQARDLLNKHLFLEERGLPSKTLLGVNRERLQTVVRVETPNPAGGAPLRSEHTLDRLSSGEKAFAQILVRLGVHLTRNTIVLIDESDLHLHPRWERGLMWSLKQLACWSSENDHHLSFIVSSHSTDMITVFNVHKKERGLVKEGFILDDDLFTGEEEVENA